MEEWYCEIAGREIGPLSSHQLKTMAVEGKILPTDRVRRGSVGQWASASRVRGLFAASPTSPSQPAAATSPQTPSPAPPSFFAEAGAVPSVAETPASAAASAPEPPSFFATSSNPSASTPSSPLPPIPPPPPTPGNPPSGSTATVQDEEPYGSENEPDGDEAMEEEIFKEPPGTELSPQARNLSLLVHARRKRQQQMMMAGAVGFVLFGVVVAGILLATSDVKKISDIKQPTGLSGLSKKLNRAATEKKSEDSEKTDSTAKKEQVKKSEPPASAKAEEPKPDKADSAALAALRMVVGDVPVRIVSVMRDTGGTDGPRLVVTVEVKNPNAKEKIAFSPWNRDGRASGATLTDDQGQTYPSKPIDAASVLGKPTPFSIEPSGTAEDVLAFELPGAKAEFLQLDLSGAAFGKEATAGFKIPAKSIIAQQVVAKAPPGAFAPKKKAAKRRSAPKPGTPEADFGLDDYESPANDKSSAPQLTPEPTAAEKPAAEPESKEPKADKKPAGKPASSDSSSTEPNPGEKPKKEVSEKESSAEDSSKTDSSSTEGSAAKQPAEESSDSPKAETEELKKELSKEWTPIN